MKCHKCGSALVDGPLYRQNPKGEAAVWACDYHDESPADPFRNEILEAIHPKVLRTGASPLPPQAAPQETRSVTAKEDAFLRKAAIGKIVGRGVPVQAAPQVSEREILTELVACRDFPYEFHGSRPPEGKGYVEWCREMTEYEAKKSANDARFLATWNRARAALSAPPQAAPHAVLPTQAALNSPRINMPPSLAAGNVAAPHAVLVEALDALKLGEEAAIAVRQYHREARGRRDGTSGVSKLILEVDDETVREINAAIALIERTLSQTQEPTP
jgi:hypothetical protein